MLKRSVNQVKPKEHLFSGYLSMKIKLKGQISIKGTVNIWHDESATIYKAVEKLKELVVDKESKKCYPWILQEFQRLGAEKQSQAIQKDVSLSISDSVLRKV